VGPGAATTSASDGSPYRHERELARDTRARDVDRDASRTSAPGSSQASPDESRRCDNGPIIDTSSSRTGRAAGSSEPPYGRGDDRARQSRHIGAPPGRETPRSGALATEAAVGWGEALAGWQLLDLGQ